MFVHKRQAFLLLLWLCLLAGVLPVVAPASSQSPGIALGTPGIAPGSVPGTNPGTISTAGYGRSPASQPASLTALPSGAKVGIVGLTGTIHAFVTLESFKLRCERAVADGCTLLVIELDTPGGDLYDSLKISAYIKSLAARGVPTIAWVNAHAYSGGALVAAACNWIVMAPASVIGDAAPINLTHNLAPTERAKLLSPLLEEFRDSATLHHYDFAIFEAMCQLRVTFYLVENPATGERHAVNEADYAWMVPPGTPAPGNGAAAPGISLAAGEAQLVGGYIPSRQIGTDADAGKWRLVSVGRVLPKIDVPFHNGQLLLTLVQDRAAEVGLSRGLVANEEEVKRFVQAGELVRYDQLWLEGPAYWLSQPWLKGLLLVLVMVGFYIEFQAPGVSVPGIVATIALILLLGAPFVIGLAAWWHVLLVLVGLVLLIVELFITPGFGVAGVLGLMMMFVGLVLVGVPSAGGMGLPGGRELEQLEWSALFVLLAVLVGGVVMYVLTRYFGSLPVFNKMILQHAQSAAGPEIAAVPAPGIFSGVGAENAGDETDEEESFRGASISGVHVGDTGVVVAGLKPTGRAMLGERILDVSSRGEWIEPKRRIRVVEVRGSLILVEAE